ncbi:MAG: hypothetical protein QM708_12140 [Propioniciclava sp.]|uniref:hypothetical protein n=1 Tax=Propioniciclava sp. TaxID=2038686 RepID=UPI0039E224BF
MPDQTERLTAHPTREELEKAGIVLYDPASARAGEDRYLRLMGALIVVYLVAGVIAGIMVVVL